MASSYREISIILSRVEDGNLLTGGVGGRLGLQARAWAYDFVPEEGMVVWISLGGVSGMGWSGCLRVVLVMGFIRWGELFLMR